MAYLLEQYVRFLEERQSQGDVMFESRGKSEDIRLERESLRLGRTGINGKQLHSVLTSKHLKIRLKASNEAGLQIVDLVAYPSQQQILQEYGRPTQITGFASGIIKVLQGKYYQGAGKANGKIFLQ
ncbi:MAG: hypothetical protein DLM69_06880 [Candidatus Chloroheliales bacterium]|nr:MAG: hypothetical protein DLM69_06880 [Chloroflexota bacterium]